MTITTAAVRRGTPRECKANGFSDYRSEGLVGFSIWLHDEKSDTGRTKSMTVKMTRDEAQRLIDNLTATLNRFDT
jgi:hypothetical protein